MSSDEFPEELPEPTPEDATATPREEPAWRLPLLVGLFAIVVLALVGSFYLTPPQPGGDEGGTPPRRRMALNSPTPVASGTVKVYVVGEVRKPGVVTLPADSRVEDAVKAAGGMTAQADEFSVNLAKRIQDEDQIVVRGKASGSADAMAAVPVPSEPAAQEPGPAPAEPEGQAVPGGDSGTGEPSAMIVEESVADAAASAGRKTSVNQASAEELDANVKGLGPALSRAIVEYRQTKPFQSLEDLLNVPGIGPKKLEEIRPFVDL